MGSLFGRKGRNEKHGRRGDVAKKSASLLAAVAVAGGSAVVGLPEAHAGYDDRGFFFRKLDESGELLGGSRWKIEYQTYTEYQDGSGLGSLYHHILFVEDGLTREKFAQLGLSDPQKALEYLRENFGFEGDQLQSKEKFSEGEYPVVDLFGGVTVTDKRQRVLFLPDLSPVEGEIATTNAFYAAVGNRRLSDPDAPTMEWSTATRFTEISNPAGYESCDSSDETSAEFSFPQIVYDWETGEYETVADAQLRNVSGRALINLERDRPDQILQDVGGPSTVLEYIYPIADFTNCKIPEPTTVTETVTETPEPSTTTVTPPTTTVTLPSTVTTTVTPPATTVTETPKTETTTATTTESATTTVTETPQTETVTETPERATVTHTPEKETETVTETPEKETVTETPKTETVTHTPDKETVTETPKASTETKISTVTAPQVTVTETPKQVTETTTLPQKTVIEQVPTTVVKDKTETVKVPPVTVTKTEKQEPTTVTATPERVTETVKVPGKKTTVVETKPGEPTTVRETVTETPDVPGVVEQPTPNAPVVRTPDTPVIPGAFSGTVVWDEDRSKHVNDGDERIPGLTVVAYKDGTEIARTTTDENGFYKFDNLEPGEYGIAVYGPDGGELFFEDKAATVVAGQEDTGNDWGFVREDAPAPVEEGKPATPAETVRMTLATTGANSYALAGLSAVLAALVALAVVSRRRATSQ